MGTLILLRGTPSSKIVLVACPECGRICKKILRSPYSNTNSHHLDLSVEYKCPVCTNKYSIVSDADGNKWMIARNEYEQDPNPYNINAKEAYAAGIHLSTKELPSMVSLDEAPDIEITDYLIRRLIFALNAGINYHNHQPTISPAVARFIEEKNIAVVQKLHHTDNQAEPLMEEVPVAQNHPVIPIVTLPPLSSDDSYKPAIDQSISGWKQKLLDLTKRNKMLQYRETKRTTLRILEPSFDELFHSIAVDEKPLSFQQPIDKDTDLRTWSLLALMETLSHPLAVHIGDIKTDGSIAERQKTLKNLRAKAKLATEEQGTNILYLSFGFLWWREKGASNQDWLKSPLVMVPVSLKLASLNAPYILERHDDDIVVNPTLSYLLSTEYGIDLPELDPDAASLENFMSAMEELTDRHGWRLTRDVSMGLMSFAKISMYHDLDRNRERMSKNHVIRAMCGDVDAVNTIPEECESFRFDEVPPNTWHQVLNADSSQQGAVLLSKAGVSFVMQGPPGTGKSQTIANIIAEGLADNKKILFVSEKAAALQVVYNRLAETRLADFCLPLHSHKVNKKEILETIGKNLRLENHRVKDSVMAELDELLHDREYLNRYVDELHEEIAPLGISIYTAYGHAAGLDHAADVPFAFPRILDVSHEAFSSMLYRVKGLENALLAMNCRLSDNPWNGCKPSTLSLEERLRVKNETQNLGSKLTELGRPFAEDEICRSIGFSPSWDNAEALVEMLEALKETEPFPNLWLNPAVRESLHQAASQAQRNEREYSMLNNKITHIFDKRIFDCEPQKWLDSLAKSSANIRFLEPYTNLSDDGLLPNAREIRMRAVNLKEQLISLQGTSAEVAKMLNAPEADSLPALRRTGAVISAVLTVKNAKKEWFDQQIQKRLCEWLEMAKSHADAVDAVEQALLEEWEKELFLLDHNAILTRYKTDYTGFFRIFKSSYKVDKNAIRACSRKVLKKIDDSDAVALLQKLKQRGEHLDWFEDQLEEARSIFGEIYRGRLTDWDTLSSNIQSIDRLVTVFEGRVPDRIIALACDEQADASKRKLLSELADKFKEEAISKLQGHLCDVLGVSFADREWTSHIYPQLDLLVSACDDIAEVTAQVSALALREISAGDVRQHLLDIVKTSDTLEQLALAGKSCRDKFGDWLPSNPDWDIVLDHLQKITTLAETADRRNCLGFVENVCDNGDIRSTVTALLARMQGVMRQAEPAMHHFASLFEDVQELYHSDLPVLSLRCQACMNRFDLLERQLDYLNAKDACVRLGLSDFTERIQDEDNTIPDVADAFQRRFYHLWITEAGNTKTAIRTFRRTAHDSRIEKFIALDKKQLSIAQIRIREKLISRFPSTNRMLRVNDEVSVLQRELEKKRRIMPIRKLFRTIPKLLMELKPCLMMSPLSVAYFLEAESYNFDMVIFDEASQIFPQDAIGAIFRGKQVIIAGDTRQLPPTNFFSASTSNSGDEYDSDREEDAGPDSYDSILESASSFLPSQTLLWHYRSRHEHLIAFSNREIYGNNLVTFPSHTEKESGSGVEFIYVEDGAYEGGGRNCNVREAGCCVELVRAQIKNYPNRSLGIIAFSERQQQTIQDEIQRFREENPAYEWFFQEDKEEAFFVKNLENVQGDERDTILFSIGYAKDRNGRMFMRFGPLGHQGGERRLNVAITRAKFNVKLVSSILPSDIDLSRTSSEGVRMLRDYIEFAMKGSSTLNASESIHEDNDEFVEVIAAFLQSKGYKVKTRHGCSSYTIDIAVRHPEDENRFIAGIECDGGVYCEAKTARDRDHLRGAVLRAMGWKLYRLWSTEWNRSNEIEAERLLSFLEEAMQSSIFTPIIEDVQTEPSLVSPMEEISEAMPEPIESPVSENPYGFSYYEEADYLQTPYVDYPHFSKRAAEILYIVSVEQPIHQDLLYRRMAGSFGNQKTTVVVRNGVDELLARELRREIRLDKRNGFLTIKDFAEVTARAPKPEATPRQAEYISAQELGAAMLAIISATYGITDDDLIEETARVFGYERKGPKIMKAMNAALSRLKRKTLVRVVDEKLQLGYDS